MLLSRRIVGIIIVVAVRLQSKTDGLFFFLEKKPRICTISQSEETNNYRGQLFLTTTPLLSFPLALSRDSSCLACGCYFFNNNNNNNKTKMVVVGPTHTHTHTLSSKMIFPRRLITTIGGFFVPRQPSHQTFAAMLALPPHTHTPTQAPSALPIIVPGIRERSSFFFHPEEAKEKTPLF
jgi:hypothetical protein